MSIRCAPFFFEYLSLTMSPWPNPSKSVGGTALKGAPANQDVFGQYQCQYDIEENEVGAKASADAGPQPEPPGCRVRKGRRTLSLGQKNTSLLSRYFWLARPSGGRAWLANTRSDTPPPGLAKVPAPNPASGPANRDG